MTSKKISAVLIMYFLTVVVSGQVSQEWVARFDGPNTNTDRGYSVAVDVAGNVYVTGESRGNGSNLDYATIKYNASGVQQWVARYNGPGNGADVAQSIVVDQTGNVYVTGYSRGTSDIFGDYATVKYDASGVQQWVARYNGPWNFTDIAYSVAVDSSGNVYVTGYSYGNDPSSDYLTIKYNSSGVQQWEARYNAGGGSDQPSTLLLDAQGNVYVTGYSQTSASIHADYLTIKYNSSGVQQWTARYDGPAQMYDQPRHMSLDASGNIYVTGMSATPDTLYDYATVKYNPSGIQQWAARYNGPNNLVDAATSIAVDLSGNVYVTGWSATVPNPVYNGDYATIKYSPSGIQQWVSRYDGPAGGQDVALSLKVDEWGSVFVTGYSEGSGTGSDLATVKYNTSGSQEWAARYNGPGNGSDEGTAIAVDVSGNVYVTGTSRNADLDYVTIKYHDTPLPVTMAYFNSSVQNNNVNLNWGTVTEINNSGFQVERKNEIENKWIEIGFVNGYGNTSQEKHYVFKDNQLSKGKYEYRLKQFDYNGNYEYHLLNTDVIIGVPIFFEVSQSYPNPSNPKSKIDFQMQFDAQVTLKVYDITGKEAVVLVNNFLEADYHSAEFDGSNLASGVYFYRITAVGIGQNFSKTLKMVLVK